MRLLHERPLPYSMRPVLTSDSGVACQPPLGEAYNIKRPYHFCTCASAWD